MNENIFSHIVDDQAGMVDISNKRTTLRQAQARGRVKIPAKLREQLSKSSQVNQKGPVFQTAILAGTMAVKNTAQLIPLCHNISLSSIKFDISLKDCVIEINCFVKTQANTGVEMEALTGVSVAALTIFDMCKSISSEIVIEDIHVVKKTGGKHDYTAKT
ncbi:MAG: cyclic pyranopterin monophosphate synthase MoaC [Myxococcales bacterium]|nr:cyclic pyranopterin monophosphate synthase MoaC [Myxococcales bacterium]USN50571.1 MAG: cyclic pyranopterin monophosphate synthase MoaC [Myxococcales bacterium]